MVTVFSAPKPFQGHIGIIQTNAIRSWTRLGSEVEVLLFGDEPGMAEAASALSARHLPAVQRAESGAPSLRDIFRQAQQAARHSTLCFVNADVLLLDDFLRGVDRVTRRMRQFLVVGRRWDLAVSEPLAFAPGWEAELRHRLARSGRLHPPVGSDYFVFPAGQYADLPDFTVGRAGWDNWMIFDGRRRRLPVIDASGSITVVHQDHDYGHLPGGVPHYRHPESVRNVEIAGGREVVFRLEDADWRLTAVGPVRRGLREWRYPRRWEADLTARLGPGLPARLVRALFRPGALLRHWLRLPGRRQGGSGPRPVGETADPVRGRSE